MVLKKIGALTFSELAVILGVIGIFTSLAVPAYICFQKTSRIEHLMKSARSCADDLSLWLSTPVSKAPLEPGVGGEGSGEAGAGAPDPRGVLEEYVRNRMERFQHKKPPGHEPLLVVVEPTGMLPLYCRRDGGVHLIPFVDSALESVGATVVVTDVDRNGGPAYDGILAVYNVEPGTK